MSKDSSKKSLYTNNCNFCSSPVWSPVKTQHYWFFFLPFFTKVRCFLWCLKGAVRLSPLSRQCPLLFCIHPGFHPLLSNRCLKCHRTHQPPFCIVHLWLFICLLVVTCCKTGEEGKWLNCMRPKVTSQLEGHCHSKSTERVWLMGAVREACGVKACLQLCLWRGGCLSRQTDPRDRGLSCAG